MTIAYYQQIKRKQIHNTILVLMKKAYFRLANITLVACALHLSAIGASAQMIAIDNASFEDPILSDLGFTLAAPPSWKAGGDAQFYGVFNPQDFQYPGATGGDLPGTASGPQLGFIAINGGTIGTLTYSGSSLGLFVPGRTYTLTVAIGNRADYAEEPLHSIALLADGAPVATSLPAVVPDGTFADISVSYTALAGDSGRAIGIELIGARNSVYTANVQANFDNVRLSSVPEPSSVLLLGLGGLLFARRRKG